MTQVVPLFGETVHGSTTLVAAMLSELDAGTNRTILTALDIDGTPARSLTITELDVRARRLAVAIRAHGGIGDRVIVPAMPGLDFHIGFLACLYAGMIAVPVPAMRSASTSASNRLGRLAGIAADCAPVAVLVPNAANAAPAAAELPGLPWVSVEQPADSPELTPEAVGCDPDTTALLQYTSGSTADPRGVVITHRNLVTNQSALRDRVHIRTDTTIVTWLPLFHDMGLCTGLVLPLVSGANVVCMEPSTFVRDPRVWLRAISDQSDVFTVAPDFAYEMCVARVPVAERDQFDLSGWRIAGNGSEPISADTMRRFAAAFAGSGLRMGALRPGYGLAESTLLVTTGRPGEVPQMRRFDRELLAGGMAVPATDPAHSVELVGCGPAVAGVDLRIVAPDALDQLAEREVGEIWINSPSNGHGYWNRAEESAAVFGARLAGDIGNGPTFVRTGDVGFLYHDELFVTGRIKDVMIIGGINYYPQDVETQAVAAHPVFAHQRAGAWQRELNGKPAITVAIEAQERDPELLAAAARAAGIAVARVVPVPVEVLVIGVNKLPRTTSGKIRRRECSAQAQSGTLPVNARWAAA